MTNLRCVVSPRRRFAAALRLAVRLVAWVLASAPGVALACPVCFAAKDEANRVAFLIVTVLLTAMPVIMIGGVIVWIARRSRQMDLEERAEQAQPQQPAEPGEPASDGGKLIPLRR